MHNINLIMSKQQIDPNRYIPLSNTKYFSKTYQNKETWNSWQQATADLKRGKNAKMRIGIQSRPWNRVGVFLKAVVQCE